MHAVLSSKAVTIVIIIIDLSRAGSKEILVHMYACKKSPLVFIGLCLLIGCDSKGDPKVNPNPSDTGESCHLFRNKCFV